MSDGVHSPEGEPWQWAEPVWRRIVGRARAGRSLAPAAWPGGARCAVAISFDADHDTIPLRDGDESPMRISQGQYGNRQAVPRIRRLLQREAIPASSSIPPSPPCCIRTKCAAWRARGTRSASTPGSTRPIPSCRRAPNGI